MIKYKAPKIRKINIKDLKKFLIVEACGLGETFTCGPTVVYKQN